MLCSVAIVAIALVVPSLGIDVDVQTTGGPVRGVREGTVVAFRGIPFAAPPLAHNRWRPPQPHPSWSEPLAAGQWASQVSAFERGIRDRF